MHMIVNYAKKGWEIITQQAHGFLRLSSQATERSETGPKGGSKHSRLLTSITSPEKKHIYYQKFQKTYLPLCLCHLKNQLLI